MILFTLSMPNVGSWDGKWTGADNIYARTRSFRSLEEEARILAPGSYFYNFGDGWCARVSVSSISAKEATKVRRNSRGFCGHDWMIDSIVQHGDIRVKPRPATATPEATREGMPE